MKRFDDEDLVAHYLHELAPQKASELESAMQTDPALAARYEAYTTMLRAYKANAATLVVDEAVMARNWKAMRPALAGARVGPSMLSRWRYPALAGAGLALAATAIFMSTRPHEGGRPTPAAAVQESGGPGLSATTTENALAGGVSMGAPSDDLAMAERRYAQERGRASRHFTHPLTAAPRDLPGDLPQALRLRTGLPLNTAYAAAPHFIPLASMSLPEPPTQSGYPDMFGPAGTAQTTASRRRSKSGHVRTGIHHEYPADLTFAMGGTLIGTREASGPGTEVRTLGATHAVTALAAFHQQLRPAVGYRIAVSYSRPDFQYALRDATTNSGQRDINGRMYELAATYVVQGPHHGALSTSVEAGGGMMALLPTLSSAETSYNLRGVAVVGVAAEVALTKHLGIHLGYRAQVFKGPDFQYSGTDKSIVGTTFFSNEPMAGIIYRFHPK